MANFDDFGGPFSHFGQFSLLGLHGQSSEVEHNHKKEHLIF